jgi:hypothetical protein
MRIFHRLSNRNGFIAETVFAKMFIFLLCALSDPETKELEKQTGKQWLEMVYGCSKIFPKEHKKGKFAPPLKVDSVLYC